MVKNRIPIQSVDDVRFIRYTEFRGWVVFSNENITHGHEQAEFVVVFRSTPISNKQALLHFFEVTSLREFTLIERVHLNVE